jgi:hypothetical protein
MIDWVRKRIWEVIAIVFGGIALLWIIYTIGG